MFYAFLAKMVGKHAKIRGFYLTEQTDRFSIKLSTFAHNSAKGAPEDNNNHAVLDWLTSRAATNFII